MKSEVTIERKDLIYAFNVALVLDAAEDLEKGSVKVAAGNAMLNSVLESNVVKILFPDTSNDNPITITPGDLRKAFANAVSDLTHSAEGGAPALLIMLMCARVNKKVQDELFKETEEEPDDPEKALADAVAGDSDEAEH